MWTACARQRIWSASTNVFGLGGQLHAYYMISEQYCCRVLQRRIVLRLFALIEGPQICSLLLDPTCNS